MTSAELPGAVAGARILLVDDEPANLLLLERVLERAGYRELRAAVDGASALEACAAWSPHLVVLDLHMPGLDGFEVMRRLPPARPSAAPVLVLTADATLEAKRQALAGGARDFLTKPLDLVEVELRVRNLLEARLVQLELEDHNRRLEVRVRERTAELDRARLEVLQRLALAAEFRDDATQEHAERVGRAAAAIGRELGLGAEEVELLRSAAPLHDVGKIGVPDHVLLKPGRLTPEEFAAVRAHTTIGAQLLSGSQSPVLRMAERIALTHHERWDGGGYPQGTRGERTDLVGRIVAVADVFDALVHPRPYKAAWPRERALAEIATQRGRQFDPDVVDPFLTVQGEVAGPEGVASLAPGPAPAPALPWRAACAAPASSPRSP